MMTAADESRRRVRQKRERAQELIDEAVRAKHSGERHRLREEARQLESECEEETAERGGDIYPPT